MSEIPCEGCISYAICISQTIIKCSDLWYLYQEVEGHVKFSEFTKDMFPNVGAIENAFDDNLMSIVLEK